MKLLSFVPITHHYRCRYLYLVASFPERQLAEYFSTLSPLQFLSGTDEILATSHGKMFQAIQGSCLPVLLLEGRWALQT